MIQMILCNLLPSACGTYSFKAKMLHIPSWVLWHGWSGWKISLQLFNFIEFIWNNPLKLVLRLMHSEKQKEKSNNVLMFKFIYLFIPKTLKMKHLRVLVDTCSLLYCNGALCRQYIKKKKEKEREKLSTMFKLATRSVFWGCFNTVLLPNNAQSHILFITRHSNSFKPLRKYESNRAAVKYGF